MARIKIINFGCSSNLAESEMIAGMLKSDGHDIVNEFEDITIINACSVKGPSVRKWLKEVENNKKVIVTGCITPASVSDIQKLNGNASIISTHNIKRIPEIIDYAIEGNKVNITEENKDNKATLPKIRKNPIIEIIPICNGCQFNCTYCATKLAKGNLFSYPLEDIIARAKQAISEGCKEIWITSQDTGAYGLDINTSLPSLLKQLLSLDGDFKVRIGMTNPNHCYRNLKELIEIYKHPKMFRFLHIPVQSGSDKVLREMKRPYNVSQYYSVLDTFRKEIPDITISTDIIAGFPTETEDDFNLTLELLRKTQPEVLNFSRYWPMKGTKAAELKPLLGKVKNSRSKRILELFKVLGLEKNLTFIGKEFNIIIDETAKNGTTTGRNDSYRPIILKGNFKLGTRIKVKITDATHIDLRANCL